MANYSSQKNWYEDFNLQQKSNWYGSIADAYHKTRPPYPQELINEAVKIAQLSSNTKILEIGCGPGTATTSLAELGLSLVCLEPNSEAYKIACKNCIDYPKVEIINTTFEGCQLEKNCFDAVIAATSFHWISSKIRYSKTAKILKDNGFLILLWNTPPQPSFKLYNELLDSIYETYAPHIQGYENIENHKTNIDALGKSVIDYGKFQQTFSMEIISKLTYEIDDYLALLSTLSPYIAMKSPIRQTLFERIRSTLQKNHGNKIDLSYLSVLQMTKKI